MSRYASPGSRGAGMWGSKSGRSRVRRGLRLPGSVESLESRLLLTADPVISEFLASNKSVLASKATIPIAIAYPDWVEIHNVDQANPLDLTGWYLAKSTKSSNLQKFAIPKQPDGTDTILPADGYLIVFASNQSSGGYFPIPASKGGGYELHANFNLGASGDSAVLSKPVPDAVNNLPVTIVSQYTWSSPAAPGGIGPQTDNVSYGIINSTTLLGPNAAAKTFVPLNDALGTTWRQAGFDDSGWVSGTTGVGFKTDGGYDGVIGTNLQSRMFNLAADAYVRAPFTVVNPAALTGLTLTMQAQDGFVVYLNGVEVARQNAPATPLWNSVASKTISDSSTTHLPPVVSFDITSKLGTLTAGTNVLAIQGLNRTLNGTDFLINPQLSATGAGGGTGYFTTPTPGAANTAGVTNFISDLQFDHEGGLYTSPFDLTISTDTTGATILYTTDGSAPTLTDGLTPTNGIFYTGPIRIGQITAQNPRATTIVRAAAFKGTLQPTEVSTESYLYLADVATQSAATLNSQQFPAAWKSTTADYAVDQSISTSSTYGPGFLADLKAVPTISLVIDPKDLFDPTVGIYSNSVQDGDGWTRAASVEVINPDGSIGFQTNAAVSMEGGGSRRSDLTPKHSFRLFFNGDFGSPSKLNEKFFPDSSVDSFDTIVLHATFNNTWVNDIPAQAARGDYIKDQFGHDSQEAMGSPSSHGTYMQLYVNGAYWGLYNPLERPDASWAASYYGGNKDDWDVVHDLYSADGDLTRWNEMFAIVNDNTITADQRFARLKPYLDYKNFADYMLLLTYLGNNDWDSHNWYAGANRVGLANGDTTFKFWAWDSERTLEAVSTNVLAEDNDLCPSRIFQQLRGSSDFRQLFADEVQKYMFNGGALTPAASKARYLARVNEIQDAVVGESARWGDVRKTPAYNRDQDWRGEVNRLTGPNGYFDQRTNAVLNQYRAGGLFAGTTLDAPTFSRPGGAFSYGNQLAIAETATTVGSLYYTLDGTDPRLPGGALSPGARAYNGALTLTTNVHVTARVYNGSAWSAKTDATFLLDTRPLVRVTEISYHPNAPSGSIYTNDDFEFVEVANNGPGAVNLQNYTLSGGVQFTFPNLTLAAGRHAVVVSNLAAFQSLYGTGVLIAGTYSGKLSNSSAKLVLTGSVGETILDFTYNDSWYPTTDGDGYTLVYNTPAGDPNNWGNAASWHASYDKNGTPGTNELPLAARGVVISELLTNPVGGGTDGDQVELYNSTSAPIDVAGWYLSDASGSPRKYKINSVGGTVNTVIAAGGYLVLKETSNFGNPDDPGTLVPFGFDKLGDHVVLSSADAEGLTGYMDSQDFAAADQDVPFVRYTSSDGTIDFVAEAAASLGSANASPLVGPVVLNEIMYDPAGTGDEYIELKNVTGSDVSLYDPNHPANTWLFTAGITFSFPATHANPSPDNPNPVIPAYGVALVTPTGITAAAFRAKYNIPAAVSIFAGYAGKLDNSGELVELSRPGAPQPDGTIPLIAVDRVHYRTAAPWATSAQGGGPSLTRVTASAYGNDPINWQAGQSGGTPGVATGGPNLAPTVLAGAVRVVTLPVSSVQLATIVSDDGPSSSLTLTWSVDTNNASGVSFADIHALSPVVSFAAGGVYVLRLTASDGELSGSSTVTITVNTAPVVNAGSDLYFTFPANGAASATLAGSASDGDALPSPSTLTTTWTVVSSPAQAVVSFSNGGANTLSPTASFSQSGVYVLRLTASDGVASTTDDVLVTIDHPPVVNAGDDASITQPTTQYALYGSVSDDGVATGPGVVPTVTSSWSVLSGPAAVTFADATKPTTTATFSRAGSYTLRLTATEGTVTTTDDVIVTVVDASLTPIAVSFAPMTSTVFAGVVAKFTDGDPTASASQFTASIAWGDGQTSAGVVSALSGGGYAVTDDPSVAHVYMVSGIYSVSVQVADVDGSSVTIASTATVTDAVSNQAPTVQAGTDQLITLPVSSVQLAAIVSDDGPSGSLTLTWSVDTNNASGVSFADIHALSPVVSFAAGGVYVLRLTASDGELSGSSTVTITVNTAPVVNAGSDLYFTFPANGAASATLAGSASDGDALPSPSTLTTTWTVVSSPAQAVVSFSNGGANTLSPTASFSQSGVYVLRLTASDGVASTTDDVLVTIDHPPVVNAGDDASITQPTTQYALYGSVSDDGVATGPGVVPTVTSSWSVLSGPAAVTFADATKPTTTATFSRAGSYTLRLTATEGTVTTTDDVIVTVVDASLTPIAVSFAPMTSTVFAGVVAKFTDGDPTASASQFTASIAWGDGQTSAGVVSALSGGGFSVSESASYSHAYAAAGTYQVSVQVADVDGSSVTIASTATVTDAVSNQAPTAASGTVTADDSYQAVVTLSGSDAETASASLVFTVTSLPTSGVLLRNGTPVTLNQKFTGSPVSLTYELQGVILGGLADSFTYVVTDNGASGGSSGTPLTSQPATIAINSAAGQTGVVRVGGTPGADTIVVGHTSDNKKLQVTLNGVVVSSGITLTTIGQVRVFGREGDDTFDVSDWTGSGSLTGGGGADTVVATKGVNFTLSDSGLATSDGMVLTLSGIGTANLIGDSSANTYTVSGWTGSGTLIGDTGTDTIVAAKDADFTLTLSSFATSDGLNLEISGIDVANLTGGVGNNTFDVSDWSRKGSLVGGGGSDTVVSSKDVSFTLSDVSLTTSAGQSLTLAGIGTANLTGGSTKNTFTVSGWTGSGSLDGGGESDTVVATKNASFVLADGSLTASDGLGLGLSGIGTATLTGGTGNNTFDVSGWSGKGKLTGGGGSDTVVAVKDADFTLGNTSLGASDGMFVSLSAVTAARLTGGVSANTFTVSSWTGSGSLIGGGGSDTVEATKNTGFTLTNASLTTGDGLGLTLAGIGTANLTGGTSGNAFAISGWTGKGKLNGGGGTDTISAAKDVDFTLGSSSLAASDGLDLTLSSVEVVNLTGGVGNNTFDVTDWTGKGALVGGGGADTVAASRSTSFTLTNNSLTSTAKLSMTLAGIGTANLTGGSGSNSFTVSGWTGAGSLTGGGGSNTVVATKDVNFALTNSSLTTSGGMNLSLASIGTANLTGGSGNNTFDVSGWTGKGKLTGGGGADTVAATKDADLTLTDTSFKAGDGTNLTLSGITLAALTVDNDATSRVVDGSKFTGKSSLTAIGSAKSKLIGGQGNDTLTAAGSGNVIMLGGGGGDILRATGTGRYVMIGGTGADTLEGNGNSLLIGGSTTYDSGTSALDAILAEWALDADYPTRIADLLNGRGLVSKYKLTSSTVINDLATDIMTDAQGATQDWFIANGGDQVTKQNGEVETDF